MERALSAVLGIFGRNTRAAERAGRRKHEYECDAGVIGSLPSTEHLVRRSRSDAEEDAGNHPEAVRHQFLRENTMIEDVADDRIRPMIRSAPPSRTGRHGERQRERQRAEDREPMMYLLAIRSRAGHRRKDRPVGARKMRDKAGGLVRPRTCRSDRDVIVTAET